MWVGELEYLDFVSYHPLAGGLIGLLGGPAFEEGAPAASAGGAVESTASGADETLYIEVRHGGGPVDPAPLFADDNG